MAESLETELEDLDTPLVSPLQEQPATSHPGNLQIDFTFSKLNFDVTPVEGACLSPTSPSSIFNKSVIKGSKGCLISAMVLCNWDNIMGPKIRYLWTSEEQDCLTLDTLNHIATHTLSGEICRDPMESNVDTKLYVIKQRNILVASYVFGAMGLSDLAVHSLSLVIPHSELKNFLHLHHLCESWMTRLIGKLRILLEKGPTSLALSTFTSYLCDFFEMLQSLHTVGVPPHITLADTAFHPEHKLEVNFLRQAIASHLMTASHSVVIGQVPSRVNLMISTLSLFVSGSDRLCCRYVSEEHPLPYHPGLAVQGLLKEPSGELNISLRDILYSPYPTTLVDLTTLEVRRSSIHKHPVRRHEVITEELQCLWRGQQEINIYPHRHLFQMFDDKDSLVKNFLEELNQLHPGCGIRETYVEQFMRILHQKALAFIKYVQAEIKLGRPFNKKIERKLKQDLGLMLQGDLKIVLSIADRLKPGLYNFVCGDPRLEPDQLTMADVY